MKQLTNRRQKQAAEIDNTLKGGQIMKKTMFGWTLSTTLLALMIMPVHGMAGDIGNTVIGTTVNTEVVQTAGGDTETIQAETSVDAPEVIVEVSPPPAPAVIVVPPVIKPRPVVIVKKRVVRPRPVIIVKRVHRRHWRRYRR